MATDPSTMSPKALAGELNRIAIELDEDDCALIDEAARRVERLAVVETAGAELADDVARQAALIAAADEAFG